MGAACDVAIQRMKALEKAMIDGNWAQAQYLELLPTQAAGLVERSEERMVSREAQLDKKPGNSNVALRSRQAVEEEMADRRREVLSVGELMEAVAEELHGAWSGMTAFLDEFAKNESLLS
eukprot:5040039-Karenia_brevis.AAC.1